MLVRSATLATIVRRPAGHCSAAAGSGCTSGHDQPVTYTERTTPVPGTVLWCRRVGQAPERTRILPDGCLDLIWDGRRLFVAGPDTTARWHHSAAGTSYVALRFSGGTGPAVLGVPADELVDLTPGLEELWPAGEALALAERASADPVTTLEQWVVGRSIAIDVDPLGPRVLDMARAGVPVAAMADQLGLSTRQLDRRCIAAFGYGPRRLTRVLRFGWAMDEARVGTALAQVAAGCGYADQAHLSREVRALAKTTPTGLLAELRGREPGYAGGSGENRSTGVPSGSRTTAYRMPQKASQGARWPS